MRGCVVFWFLVFSGEIFASIYGPLDGTLLETVEPAGPIQRSSIYIVNAPVKIRRAKADLVLDTPAGAMIVFLEQGPKGVHVINARGEETSLGLGDDSDVGQEVGLGTLPPGKHHLELTGVTSERADFIVSQPNSPLILNVQSKPLSVHTGDIAQLIVTLDDKFPPKRALVEASFSNGQRRTLVQNQGGVFSVSFPAPAAKKGMDDVGVEVIASGIRYDGSPFKREAMTHFMVTSSVIKIEKDIFVNETGDIEIDVSPTSRSKGQIPLRLDVYYVYQGKKMAWAREDFSVGEEPQHVTIQRPNIAKAADGAFLRLVNMEHFGVEDTRMVRLPRDPEAAKHFIFAPIQALPLPERKRRALDPMAAP